MTKRLTEDDVHTACAEIALQGERPTSLNLLNKLGRGSLTTISKYLTTWNKTSDAQAIDAASLPAAVQLPDELSANGEDFLKKVWNIAKGIADRELDIQRESLKQTEIENQMKVEEAFKFSEAQALKIERLEEDFTSLKNQLDAEFTAHKQTTSTLNDAEKANVGLSKDNERLQHEISALKVHITSLETANKTTLKENKSLEKKYAGLIKTKDKEIRSLDIQVNKNQTALDSSIKTNNELILSIKSKSSKLETCHINLEKTGLQLESIETDLKTTKSELKAVQKKFTEGERLIARLEGQLAVYEKIEAQKK